MSHKITGNDKALWQMEIGNFSLGNSEIGNCSYENPHVSFSNGDELSFCFYGIDQAAFLFTFIKKGDRKTWYQIDFKIVTFLKKDCLSWEPK